MKKEIKIGSRGSALALWQANWVRDSLLKHWPELIVTIEKITTSGDRFLDAPLSRVGGKGLFTKEIEEALLDHRVDIAVHSMKDVPAALPEDLSIAVITEREDPRDVLISKENITLKNLPQGATVGTSSLRRQAQLLKFRPDLKITPLRGNVVTRISKLENAGLDAIVLAAAGVKRLQWEDKISEYIDINICLPAIGQGALGLEIRENDKNVLPYINDLDHYQTHLELTAERALLKKLQGGCQVPVAAHAKVDGGNIKLTAMVSSLDGKRFIEENGIEPLNMAEQLGLDIAEKLLLNGAEEIIQQALKSAADDQAAQN
ncbi:MAG: hydroxymethylbilane synthase [Nitrospinota bacterium]|nr:hydroxymethylbilane synthase [Nitrospinota bacterium]